MHDPIIYFIRAAFVLIFGLLTIVACNDYQERRADIEPPLLHSIALNRCCT